MGGDRTFLEVVRERFSRCFLTTEEASKLNVTCVSDDCSQMLRSVLHRAQNWDNVTEKMQDRFKETLAGFENLKNLEFLFPESAPPCRQVVSRARETERMSRPVPVVHYSNKDVKELELSKRKGPILDMERYLVTPELKSRMLQHMFCAMDAYPLVTTRDTSQTKIVFNGIPASWLSPDHTLPDTVSTRNIILTKHELPFNQEQRVYEYENSSHVGEEDLKAVRSIVENPKETHLVRSIDGDLIVILLLCCDRLVQPTGWIEGGILLDLSGRWKPGGQTYAMDSKGKPSPYLLDVVKMFRYIVAYFTRTQNMPRSLYRIVDGARVPHAPFRFPVHSFCAMALLAGNDYARHREGSSGVGLPGVRFKTLWNSLHANRNVQKAFARCIKDKDDPRDPAMRPPLTFIDDTALRDAVEWIYHEILSVHILKRKENEEYFKIMKKLGVERKAAMQKYKANKDTVKPPDEFRSRIPVSMPRQSYDILKECSKQVKNVSVLPSPALDAFIRRVHWCYLYCRNADTGCSPNPIYTSMQNDIPVSVWGWECPPSAVNNHPTHLSTCVTPTADPRDAWGFLDTMEE